MSEVFSFTLGPVNLGSALMLLESDGLSGVLGAAERVGVSFVGGQIVGASCGPLSGVSALRTLFFLRDLRFSFDQRELPPADPIVAVVRAIIDAARLQDDWGRLGPMVLKPTIEVASAPGSIQTLLRRLDGVRPLQKATMDLGLSPAVVVDPVLELLETGKLREVAAQVPQQPWPGLIALRGAQTIATAGEGGRNPLDDEYERALEEGRKALKEGDLPNAESAFLLALDLRPDDRIAAQNLRRVRQLRER